MKRFVFVVFCIAAAGILSGCRAVTVRNYGEELVRDADGKPLLASDGTVQTVKLGWKVHHNQHWMATDVDAIEAKIKPGEVSFALGKLSSKPSEELNKLVDTSLKGAAELAARIGAAIATSGGSVAGDAGYSALRAAVAKFVARGGDVANANITCADGGCTISDGSVSETCADCIEK